MQPIGPFVLCSLEAWRRQALQRCSAASFGSTVDVNSLSSRQKTARGSRGELAAVRHTSMLEAWTSGGLLGPYGWLGTCFSRPTSFRLRKALNAASRALPASLAAAVGCVRHGCAAA